MSVLRFGPLALALASRAAVAAPGPGASAEVLAERDRLIERIASGQDSEASARRFALLRDSVMAERDAEEARKLRDRKVQAETRELRKSYEKTADHEVGWRCTLSPDPAHPLPSDEGRFRADWGRVVRRETVALPPKNALDDGERWTLVEVQGAARSYVLHDEVAGVPDRTPLGARIGDLVLICDGGRGRVPRLPDPWAAAEVQSSGFAVRVAAPPKIAAKARWNPIHITGTRFFWAIHDVKWKYPEGAYVLANLEIAEDLGGGRFRVDSNNGTSWVLEAKPGLARRELLAPGHAVWAILGQARFDRDLKKLVLVAEDLEERYVVEK